MAVYFFPGAYGACIVCVGDHKNFRAPRWYMDHLHYIPRLRRLHSLRGKFNNICASRGYAGNLNFSGAYGACIVCVGDHKKKSALALLPGECTLYPRLRRPHSLCRKFNNICSARLRGKSKFLGRLRRLHACGAIKKNSALRAATWAISVGVQTHKPT